MEERVQEVLEVPAGEWYVTDLVSRTGRYTSRSELKRITTMGCVKVFHLTAGPTTTVFIPRDVEIPVFLNGRKFLFKGI